MADGPAAARRLNEQAEEFRSKAAECQRLAEASSDNFIAGEYLQLAEQLRALADQVERHTLFRG